VINPRPKQKKHRSVRPSAYQVFDRQRGPFENLMPKSEKEVSIIGNG
jgi:hypothetical protein